MIVDWPAGGQHIAQNWASNDSLLILANEKNPNGNQSITTDNHHEDKKVVPKNHKGDFVNVHKNKKFLTKISESKNFKNAKSDEENFNKMTS